jgi:hypothetical protein
MELRDHRLYQHLDCTNNLIYIILKQVVSSAILQRILPCLYINFNRIQVIVRFAMTIKQILHVNPDPRSRPILIRLS